MGRAQGRMKLHSWIHSLCLDHLYPPLHPDSGLGRDKQEAPGLLGAAGSEQPLGNLRVPCPGQFYCHPLLGPPAGYCSLCLPDSSFPSLPG